MTQMNAAVTSSANSGAQQSQSQNSPQCFSQNSSNGSELASPEENEESVGSADSVRDRSHLFLDPGNLRGPQNFLSGLKRRTNFGPNLFDPPAASAAAPPAPTVSAATNNANNNTLRNGFAASLTNPDVSMLSPMLQKDFLQVVNAMMSPANRRPSNFPLPSSLAQSAFNNIQKSNLLSSIAETPTPTKILYPSQVTEEAQEFAEGFTKVLEKIQAQNQFCATSLASPSTNLLLPLINAALTPTNPLPPSIVTSAAAANNANTAALNAIIAALTPTLTPTQTATTEQLFAVALASLATTPTGNHPSPTTNFPPLPQISQQHQQQQQFSAPTTTTTSGLNQSLSNSSTVATGGNQTASAPIPTTTTTTAAASAAQNQSLTDIYKNLDSNIMDHMFSNHADLNFNGLMSHFGQNGGMPPHSQPLSQHNGYHQPGLNGSHQGPPQQPGMIPIKSEPNNNGYGNGIGHSLQGSAATGMCQPPPQNLSCAPSTSSHQMASYQSHLSNNLQELELNEQERRKLERKRARNRMAASKCRQRKIERISQLEGEVQQERQRYQSLQNSINSMEKTISMLQGELQRHKHSGCALDKSTLNLMNHLSTIMNNNAAVPMDTR